MFSYEVDKECFLEEMCMWTSIYIANNRKQADHLKTLLSNEEILTNIRPVGIAATTGEGMFEIQVLESEVDEAQAIVCQGPANH